MAAVPRHLRAARRCAARRLGAHRRGRVRLRAAAARRVARRPRAPRQGSLLTAIAAITLLLGPPVREPRPMRCCAASRGATEREADDFTDARGSVLVIGFGRFGQIVSQYLLAEDIDVTTIDIDPEMIQVAGRLRLQGLLRRRHAARRAARGRRRARRGWSRSASTTRTDQPHRRPRAGRVSRHEDLTCAPSTAATRCSCSPRASTTSCAKPTSPRSSSGARRWKRSASMPSARRSSRISSATRDLERLAVQQAEGISAGLDLLRTRMVHEPLSAPTREVTPLNPEAKEIIDRPPAAE